MKLKQIAYANQINNEVPVVSFEMISDLHITLPKKNKYLTMCLEDIKNRNILTVAILGDVTNNGYSFQWKTLSRQLQKYSFNYLIALGNHDTYNLFHKHQLHIPPTYKQLSLHNSHTVYYDCYINGIHIYVLNTQRPVKTCATFYHDQLSWLEENLKRDDVKKPIFVFSHHPLANTHASTNEHEFTIGFQSAEIKRILKQHPHVLYCSGHIHNNYILCDALFDEHLALLDVPSFQQVQHGFKREHIGYHIEVFHDFVYIKTRDYQQATWITSNEYIIDFRTHHVLPFDQDFLMDKAVQQKSKQN